MPSLVAMGLLLVGRPGQACATIVYEFVSYTADQEGATLSGSITTDGTLGKIGAFEIVDFTFTVSKPSKTPYSHTFSVSGGNINTAGDLLADATNLYLDNGAKLTLSNVAGNTELFYDNDGDSYLSRYLGDYTPGWNETTLTVLPTDGSPWLIASAAAAVPEPSMVVWMLLVTKLVFIRSRRRSMARRRHWQALD